MTGQTTCAYCEVSLIDSYHHWLLLTVDHVVPAGEARRLGIPPGYYEDAINLVLACSGCNMFDNHYACSADPAEEWSLEQFLALRDAAFAERFGRIATRREQEIAVFERRPWNTNSGTASAPSANPIDGLVTFTDNDAGYLAWLSTNPAGFVINTLRTPSVDNLILHRATCGTITGTPARGDQWTGQWVKVCSQELAALDDWARREVGGDLRPCGRCRPPTP
jgi:hypothetical protein